jgi:hypothetical protein
MATRLDKRRGSAVASEDPVCPHKAHRTSLRDAPQRLPAYFRRLFPQGGALLRLQRRQEGFEPPLQGHTLNLYYITVIVDIISTQIFYEQE